MDKKLDQRLRNIEDKIIRLNNREARKRNFKINLNTLLLGAVITFGSALFIEWTKYTFRNDANALPSFIGWGFVFCIIIAILFWDKSKELMDIKDFIFNGDLNLNNKEKRSFTKKIIKIIESKNYSLSKSYEVKFYGLYYFIYIFYTFRADQDKKFEFILKNMDKVKCVRIFFEKKDKRWWSDLVLDFDKNKIEISLDERDFSVNDAEKVLNELKKLHREFDFLNEGKTKIRGL